MTDETINTEQPELRKSRFGYRARFVAIVVLLSITLLGGVALALVLAEDKPKPRSVEDQAIDMCQDAVLQSLKAPSTADFVGEPIAFSDGGEVAPVYTVTGEVDAENSFGAMLRNLYTCDIQTSNDRDSWTVEAVDIVLCAAETGRGQSWVTGRGRGGTGVDWMIEVVVCP
ncbi:hypothetical protein [Stackebrandtia nassauensis]|uniref:Uncharacterized protein n=1 Tax=Stackebrandtia nassauensis (strain DSM 44728 / CIP 108903 / NRRL B-16338 / NBRC 102104 / LLR-40K-21) TaxID=446470 RepID=D3PZ94_STANL|nr:hypothetical protein [Stackebrandtia nassauensis]ADD41568.1 hypothetical protein Snas_1872 [Stackebrandtia nassauensis DSM 44728]